jgi:dynein heavy chain
MVGDSLTDITLELYSAVLEKLPPTPSRFHYVFNLRDLSRVYEGLLRSCSDVVQEPWQFLRLWRNEVRCDAAAAAVRYWRLRCIST